MTDLINWHGEGMSAVARDLPNQMYLVRSMATQSGGNWAICASESEALIAAESMLGEVQFVRVIAVEAEHLELQTEVVRRGLVPVGTAVSS